MSAAEPRAARNPHEEKIPKPKDRPSCPLEVWTAGIPEWRVQSLCFPYSENSRSIGADMACAILSGGKRVHRSSGALAYHALEVMHAFEKSSNLKKHIQPKRKRAVSENAEFIEIRDAAEWLGVPVSSLRQYVSQGLLPSYKLGRHRLFRKRELLEAIRQTTKATLDEILR